MMMMKKTHLDVNYVKWISNKQENFSVDMSQSVLTLPLVLSLAVCSQMWEVNVVLGRLLLIGLHLSSSSSSLSLT